MKIHYTYTIKAKNGRSFEGGYTCNNLSELKTFIKFYWMANAMPPKFDLRTLRIISKIEEVVA